MKRLLQIAALVLCFTVLTAAESLAGNVRGLLLRRGPQGTYPAAGIAVTVYAQQLGRSRPGYSGSDGMYYLYNVPAGWYYLEIWAHGFGNPPLVFQIFVNDQQPFTDVTPVTVP
ncbi:MAG: carboxypeptidase regulatory-like domain-containing protein [Acidobacteria bacterium]|nr:carboxypeptidase regulatory-like domain-containing protein [Acidobacteriota bacterium]